jgi:hypothetical protein
LFKRVKHSNKTRTRCVPIWYHIQTGSLLDDSKDIIRPGGHIEQYVRGLP